MLMQFGRRGAFPYVLIATLVVTCFAVKTSAVFAQTACEPFVLEAEHELLTQVRNWRRTGDPKLRAEAEIVMQGIPKDLATLRSEGKEISQLSDKQISSYIVEHESILKDAEVNGGYSVEAKAKYRLCVAQNRKAVLVSKNSTVPSVSNVLSKITRYPDQTVSSGPVTYVLRHLPEKSTLHCYELIGSNTSEISLNTFIKLQVRLPKSSGFVDTAWLGAQTVDPGGFGTFVGVPPISDLASKELSKQSDLRRWWNEGNSNAFNLGAELGFQIFKQDSCEGVKIEITGLRHSPSGYHALTVRLANERLERERFEKNDLNARAERSSKDAEKKRLASELMPLNGGRSACSHLEIGGAFDRCVEAACKRKENSGLNVCKM